jgi:hypothetical protein
MKKTEFELAIDKQKNPSVPEFARVKTRKRKKTETGELTHLILKYCEFKGAVAYRMNSTGIYDAKLKRYRFTGQKKGLADVMAIYRSRHISIEVKAQKTDKLSIHQLQRKAEIEQAGANFIEARTFDQFQIEFDIIISKIDQEYNTINKTI